MMGDTLVPVPASNEEHGRSVRNGTNDGTSSDTSSGCVHRATGIDVTTQRSTITRAASWRGTGVGALVGAGVVARKLAAGWQWTGCVDKVGQSVDSAIFVVVEGIERVANLSSQSTLEIFGDGEQRKGGDETLVRSRVKWLETNVLDVGNADVETISDSFGEIVENLLSTIVGRNEGVIELPLEADLAHEAVGRDICWDTAWRSNHLGQRRGNTDRSRRCWHVGSGLLDDVRSDD